MDAHLPAVVPLRARRIRRLAPILTAVAATALGAPSAAPAQTPVRPLAPATVYGTYAQTTGLTAAAGWTAWSVRQGAGWRLMLRAPGGAITTPAVAPRSIPFDAALGVRSGGAVVLAYSRCTRDPRRATGGAVLAWHTARGCSLNLLDVAGGTVTRLPRTSGATADVLPAVSGARLAYASIPQRGSRGGIFSRSLSGGRSRRLFTGPARRVVNGSADIAQGPLAVAADARHTAFLWVFTSNVGVPGLSTWETKLIANRGGANLTLSSAGGSGSGTCSGYTDLRSLSLVGGHAVAERVSPVGWELQRVALDQPLKVRRKRARAAVRYGSGLADPNRDTDEFLPSVAVDASRLALTAPDAGGISVGELPLAAWRPASRLDDPYGCG